MELVIVLLVILANLVALVLVQKWAGLTWPRTGDLPSGPPENGGPLSRPGRRQIWRQSDGERQSPDGLLIALVRTYYQDSRSEARQGGAAIMMTDQTISTPLEHGLTGLPAATDPRLLVQAYQQRLVDACRPERADPTEALVLA
jgi:hypothetical protein